MTQHTGVSGRQWCNCLRVCGFRLALWKLVRVCAVLESGVCCSSPTAAHEATASLDRLTLIKRRRVLVPCCLVGAVLPLS